MQSSRISARRGAARIRSPMQLQEIKKNRVYERIVTQVQNLIVQGQLKNGDRLPPERDLVETFNVSRASVREAICVLESLGLVESRVGSGTYVTAANVENLIQPLALTILQEQDNIREIFEVRRLIEPFLAEQAAERATESQIDDLAGIVHRHTEMVARGEAGSDADSEFHLAIAQAACNQVFLRLIDGIHDLLRKTRDSRFQTGGRPKLSLRGHQKVLEAIQQGDGSTAHSAMDEHLATVEEFVRKNYNQENSAGGRPSRKTAKTATNPEKRKRIHGKSIAPDSPTQRGRF